jgi:uncharacterized tellurite resistance protein B-like protein
MDPARALELIKLLMQVAWSDLALSSKEIAVVLEAAKRWGVPENEAIDLVTAIADRRSLPAPNLALLGAVKDEAMEMAKQVVGADGVVRADEEEILAEIEGLLSESEE